jgi:hypothetical protein
LNLHTEQLTNCSDAYEELIEVIFGLDDLTKTFRVYRGLLCFHAKYFVGLLDGGFAEAGSQSIRLADVDVDVFQCFYYWTNSGTLEDLNTPMTYPDLKLSIKAYAFADY